MSHDPSPERTVLGAYLLQPTLARRSLLEPEHFAKERHRALYELLRDREWSDQLEVVFWLGDHPQSAKACGGIAYVQQHADGVSSTEGVAHYEGLLVEAHRRRLLAQAAVAAQTQSYDGVDSLDVASNLRQTLDEIDACASDVVVSPDEAARVVMEDVDGEASGDRVSYLATGWADWDREWVGIPSEGVILFLARSGMGKTSLVNSMAVAMARSGMRVHIHGTETSAKKRARAIVFGMSGISPRAWGLLTRLHSEGSASPQQIRDLGTCRERLQEASEAFARLPLHLTGSGLSCERVCAEARRQHRLGCRCLFVDYIQDFPFSKGLKQDRTPQVVHHSRLLKNLSAELYLPVVEAAQVSGEKEGMPRKGAVVPQMWDAQWASGLHQDAEEVYAINRADYWHQRLTDIHGAEPQDFDESRWGELGVLGITARKRRECGLGHIALAWDGPRRWVGPTWSDYRHQDLARAPQHWHETDAEWRT